MFRFRHLAIIFAVGNRFLSSFPRFSTGKRTITNLFVVKKVNNVVSTALRSTSNKVDSTSRSSYLFGDGEPQTFQQLGVVEALFSSLSDLNFLAATTIQASCFPIVMEGKDIVIGAETGSGKTLAYLLPIIQMALCQNESATTMDVHYPFAVIMVPNKELCRQVCRVANSISQTLRKYSAEVAIDEETFVTGEWPYRRTRSPDILICTPAYMASFVRGPMVVEEDLYRSVRVLVLDEADMLLEGSYLTDVERVMDAFKVVRRSRIREGELQVHESSLQCVLAAATLPTYGMRSIDNYVKMRFPNAVRVSNAHMHKQHPRIKQRFVPVASTDVAAKERIDIITAAMHFLSTPLSTSSTPVPGPEEAVIAAATKSLTMIFANTADRASLLAAALREAGTDCLEFHKLLSSGEKEENLERFRAGEVPVLVCTDHAARGLDLPNVRHVIQAEFALNVVQHLHRVGRASRAGALGAATNLYDNTSSELVASIQSEGDFGSVDQSFSRRRGFRQKIRKAIRRATEPEPYY